MSLRPSLLLLLLLLSLWSTASLAVETAIRGTLALEPGIPATPVTLRLIPQSEGAAALPEPVTAVLEVPGETRIDLAPGILWRLEAEAPDLWSEPRWLYLKADEEAAPVHLSFFPVTDLTGALDELPPGEAPPAQMELRFEPSPGHTAKAQPPRSSVTCPVRDRRFQCKVPVSVLDLRLRAEGFVPVYRWDVALSQGPARDLGPVALIRGSSISGWVEIDGGKPASAECRVQLAPQALGIPSSPATRDSLEAMTLETRVNARGFFQITGVEPGFYVLSATQPGLARASLAPVEVRKGLETALTNPVLLTQPAKLSVALHPALDPWGRPWTVHVQRSERDRRGASEIERGPASKDGLWERTGLPPGSYLLLILGDSESRWLTRQIEVQPGAQTIDAEIPVVQVRGRITLGDEPLQATLWLGGLHGPRRIRFDSDGQGDFEGMLPSAGLWEVDLVAEGGLHLRLAPVEVVLSPGSSRATVTIRVPDTRLRGEVIDEDGKPLEGASVRLMLLNRKSSMVKTDAEGRFELRGLEAGRVTVEASLGSRTSGWVSATIAEEGESPWLRLVARAVRTVHGRVFSAQGPVVGARIQISTDMASTGFSTATLVQEVSGPAGEFTVTLPAQSQGLNVTVEAPGHAIRMFRTVLPKDQVLEIPLEPVGGTLVIDLGEATPELVSRAGAGLLLHGGTFVPFQQLQQWARLGRADARSAHQLMIPNLEPGDYMLCSGVSPQKAMQNGASAGSCAQGRLGPLQELVLALPSFSAAPE